MANSGKNTNGCQFFITTGPADFLDGKHVCFGSILDGGDNMLILRKIENVPTGANNRPKLAVKITGASMLSSQYLPDHLCRMRRDVERMQGSSTLCVYRYIPLRLLPTLYEREQRPARRYPWLAR